MGHTITLDIDIEKMYADCKILICKTDNNIINYINLESL